MANLASQLTEFQVLADGGEGAVDQLRMAEAPSRLDTTTALTRSPELPRPAVAQILDALRLAPGSVDLSLSPEELGRVSLSMQMQDDVLTVIVNAERPETADIIRRNLDVLLQEARAEGFGELAFGFGESHQGSDAREDDPREPTSPDAFGQSEQQLQASRLVLARSSTEGGLDLRL